MTRNAFATKYKLHFQLQNCNCVTDFVEFEIKKKHTRTSKMDVMRLVYKIHYHLKHCNTSIYVTSAAAAAFSALEDILSVVQSS